MLNLNDEKYDELEVCEDCPLHGEPEGCNRADGPCRLYEAFLELKDEVQILQSNLH